MTTINKIYVPSVSASAVAGKLSMQFHRDFSISNEFCVLYYTIHLGGEGRFDNSAAILSDGN
ncbi:MAG: hypothetical protein PUP93_09480 [Rhizonema sp. NSF051]|nr:hypothetical protein [Rhizonema sp. NSF051]